MSGILLLTHQSTSPEGLPKTWVELSSGEKISCHREETAEAIYNVMNKQYFWDIEKLLQQYESWEDFSEEQRQKMGAYFQNPAFLHFLEWYLSREINELYKNGNTDAFRKVSELGFLLARWDERYESILSDIHNISNEKLKGLFYMYEESIRTACNTDRSLLRQNLNLYIKLIDTFTLISIFNEMDHDRRQGIQSMSQIMHTSIIRMGKIEWILDETLWYDTFWAPRETVGERLTYVEGRWEVNFTHSQELIFEWKDHIEMIQELWQKLEKIYDGYRKLVKVNFLCQDERQNTLTGAFISNTTSLMLVFIENILKTTSESEREKIFWNHIFVQLINEYQSQIHCAFTKWEEKKSFIEETPTNFIELNTYCIQVLLRNYNRVLYPDKLENIDISSAIFDLKNSLQTNNIGKQIEFRMEFLYKVFFYSLSFDEKVLQEMNQLLSILVDFKKFDHYHTQAVKIKLIDVLLKKIFETTQKAYQNEEILEQTLHYLEKNKKNSLLLNVYARLYLTLSYCYSQISSQKQKSMNLYFIYEELATSKKYESRYGITTDDIFQNIFGQRDVWEIKQQDEYGAYNKEFINQQWHTIQKLINELDHTKKLDAFEKWLELINEWFFHGMVKIWVIMDEVDEESIIPRGYARERMAFEMDGVAHTILLDYPTNYRKNFFEIYHTRRDHLQEQIIGIYRKLELYTSPVEKKIQNTILEALENNTSWFEPYYMPIVDSQGQTIGYEALCRLVNEEWDEIVLRDEKNDRIYIDKTLLVAEYLWFSNRITKRILKTVFDIASQEPQFDFNVNLSYEDVMDQNIVSYIWELMWAHSYRNIVIELLENKIHDMQGYVEQLRKLIDFWCKIAIDDFGSEYQNTPILEQFYLHWVQVLKLKIDKRVILDISSSDDIKSNVAIETIKYYIKLAQLYWIKWWVIAEWIWDKDTWDKLINLWVEWSQWFFFGKPNKTLEIKK